MRFESDEVVILTRTVMNGGVCVGAYDVANRRMIRLLGAQANKLTVDAEYQIGQFYSMVYADRYNVSAPHTEDVAVYEAEYQEDYDDDEFDELIESLTDYSLDLEELFEGKLNWDMKGFVLRDSIPSFSVQIVTLNCDLIKSGDYFEQRKWGIPVKNIKYVGQRSITALPRIIQQGSKIRFSLARFWDKGDGIERAYLQISGVY